MNAESFSKPFISIILSIGIGMPLFASNPLDKLEKIPDKFVVLNLSENHGALTNDYKTIGNTTKTKLQSMPGNYFISNYYRTSDGYEVAPLNSLLICGTKGKSIEKTMEALDLQDKIAQIRQLNITPVWYAIDFDVKDIKPVYDLIEQSKLVETVEYNFFGQIAIPNSIEWDSNPQFVNRKYLFEVGKPYTNISAIDVWEMGITGNGVKVGVIDSGIDGSHPDLSISGGYDYITMSNYNWYTTSSQHGTSVADIIGARHNSILGIGVAYNCTMYSLRTIIDSGNGFDTEATGSLYEKVATSILDAYQTYDCDVINMSFHIPDISASLIENALSNAAQYGRNGKGCVLIASSGNIETNNPDTTMKLPAIHEDVFSVGALTRDTQTRASFSKYIGCELDAIASGDPVYACARTGISLFEEVQCNGTSFSAPIVSGISALILQQNSNLTANEVYSIIRQTCGKPVAYTFGTTKPDGTWNNEVGYGSVNAFRAVTLARLYKVQITGGDSFVQNSEIFGLSNVESADTVSWSCKNAATGIEYDNYLPFTDNGQRFCMVNNDMTSGQYVLSATIRRDGASRTVKRNIILNNDMAPIGGTYSQNNLYYNGVLVSEYTSNISQLNLVYPNNSVYCTLFGIDGLSAQFSGPAATYWSIYGNDLYFLPSVGNATYSFTFSRTGTNIVKSVSFKSHIASSSNDPINGSEDPENIYIDFDEDDADDMACKTTVVLGNILTGECRKLEFEGNHYIISKSGLANGVYVIRASRGGCEYTKKIIVKH